MSSPAPFGAIADLFERSLNIRHVYGEPVHNGDTTVIPVAQVATPSAGVAGADLIAAERTGLMCSRPRRR